jgi:hypothetical protein
MEDGIVGWAGNPRKIIFIATFLKARCITKNVKNQE